MRSQKNTYGTTLLLEGRQGNKGYRNFNWKFRIFEEEHPSSDAEQLVKACQSLQASMMICVGARFWMYSPQFFLLKIPFISTNILRTVGIARTFKSLQ